MVVMKLKNPFLTRGYAGADYFCDRANETRKLIAAFENDRDVTLIAPGVRVFEVKGTAGCDCA